MKTLTLSLLALLTLAACGARTPLRRGQEISVQLPPGFQKPADNKPTDQPATDVDKTYYDTVLYPVLEKSCTKCHDDYIGAFDAAKKKIVFKKPDQSELYLRATGVEFHGFKHRQIFKPDSAEAVMIVTWINGGKVTQ